MALRECGRGQIPEVVDFEREVVALHDERLAIAKLDELELVVVRNEAETVFVQVTPNLLGLRECGEAFARRFDFDGAALGKLTWERRVLAFLRNRKEAAIGKTCSP
jgi:hypothetical protein